MIKSGRVLTLAPSNNKKWLSRILNNLKCHSQKLMTLELPEKIAHSDLTALLLYGNSS